jgi:hypothetical protein
MVNKKSTGKQIALTVLLVGILLSTFLMVFAVDYYYTNQNGTGEIVELFTTDVNQEYPHYNYDPVGLPSPFWDSIATGQFHAVLPNFWQFNRTPAYLGNNTWSISVNDTGQAVAPQFVQVVMPIDNLPNMIITEMVVNITLNADADLLVEGTAQHFNEPQDQTDSTRATLLFNDALAGGITFYNRSYPISLTNSLRIFDISQETDTNLIVFIIADLNGDGLSAWACQWKVTLYGRSTLGWTEQTTIAVVLLLGTAFNLIGGWFALDQNDWGKDVKDIPPKRTRKPKTKKRKSKRRSR